MGKIWLKNWFFVKTSDTDKSLVSLIMKKDKTQTYIRNERGNSIMDYTDYKRIIREYYEQLDANKINKLDELIKFLKDTNYKNSLEKKQITWIALYLF